MSDPLDTPRQAFTGALGLGPEKRLEIQYSIARAFAEALDLDDVAPLVLRTLADALGWEAGGLWLVDPLDGSLTCRIAYPDEGPLRLWAKGSLALRLEAGQGLPGRVAAGGGGIWVRDTDDEPNFPRRHLARRTGLRHGFGFPVRVRGRVVAVVELFGRDVRDIDREQIGFLEAIGHQLASFLERTETRRALAESEATKSAILQAAVDAIVSARTDGHIVEFNPAAETMFARRRDDVIGRSISELLVPDELRAAHLNGLARYLATGEPRIIGRRVRTRAARADGTAVPVELTVTDTGSGAGRLFTAFIRDITLERQAETARDRFLEILSHELRTPVTAIYGGAQVLARPTLSESRRADLIADIGAEADRLYRLVEDLIVLARAEGGRDEISLEPVLLERIAERVVSSSAPRWPKLDIRLSSEGSPNVILGEETYVEQVLRNLLTNAAKYASGGRLVEITITHLKEETLVRVLDRGPGIAADEADRLFELGYRSQKTGRDVQGSGIGLFVTRWLVEAMGGRVWAAPRSGGGSEFGFALQRTRSASRAPASSVVALGTDQWDAEVAS